MFVAKLLFGVVACFFPLSYCSYAEVASSASSNYESLVSLRKNAWGKIYMHGSAEKSKNCNAFIGDHSSHITKLSFAMKGRLLEKVSKVWVFPKKTKLTKDEEVFLFLTLRRSKLNDLAQASAWTCSLYKYSYESSKYTWLELGSRLVTKKWGNKKTQVYKLEKNGNLVILKDSIENYFLHTLSKVGGGDFKTIEDYLRKNGHP